MARPYSRLDKDGKRLPPRGTYVRPRKDGSEAWYARYSDQFGRVQREYAGNTQTDALRLYRQRKHEVETGRFQAKQKGEPIVYMASVLDHYLPVLMAEHSQPRNDVTLHKFWKERLGELPLTHITRGMIAKWRAEALKKWEPGGVQRKVAWLRKVLSLCVQDGILPTHPLAHLRGLELPNSECWHFLTLRERLTLREACLKRKRGLWALVFFALSTGLRQHEQFSLLWKHVDFEHQVLTIPRRRGKSPGSSKRKKVRRVPLHPVEHLLRRWEGRREASRFVFPRKDDPTQHLSANGVYKRHFRPAADAAGLPQLRWHDLRHTFISDRLEAGEDLEVIRELAGHTDIRTTQHYLHLRQGREAEAMVRAKARAQEQGVWRDGDEEF